MIEFVDAQDYYESSGRGSLSGQLFPWGSLWWAPSFHLLEAKYERVVRSNYVESRRGYVYDLDRIDWSTEFEDELEPNIDLVTGPKDRSIVVPAKRRPVIIVSGPVSKFQGDGKRVVQECFLVAPLYSLEGNDKKMPFSPEFIARVKAYAYPQFFYLPAHGKISESFVRFDRIQVLRKDLLESWSVRLTDRVGDFLRCWLRVYQGEDLQDVDDFLFQYRTEYMKLLGLNP